MSTPTPVTTLARRWRLEVNMGTTETPDWQLCPAITAFQPEYPPNFEDSGVYDDGGWGANTKTGQDWSLKVTINRKASADATTYNAVHEALRVASFEFDTESEVGVRWMDRNGLPEAYQGTALVTWAPSGGSRTDLDQVEITLTGTGVLSLITNPITP